MDNTHYDIALIGGGASGTLVAMQLLIQATRPVRIAMIEPGPVGRGVAYSTTSPEHLLNVPAARMSALVDVPDDFVAFLAGQNGFDTLQPGMRARVFAPRRMYAAYLADRLAQVRTESLATLDVVASRAIRCAAHSDHVDLTLDSGASLRARHVVIALGNTPKPTPLPTTASAHVDPRVLGAWDYAALKTIDPDAAVTIVGAGHSMVDAMLSLDTQGHRGAIHVLSRTGQMPLPHAASHGVSGFDALALRDLPLRARMRALRQAMAHARVENVPWQDVMDRVRPHVRTLWASMDPADTRRFLRHVVRQWDVHRHRIAPQVHGLLQAAIASGQLRVHRGRLLDIDTAGARLQIHADGRDGAQVWATDVVINAVGLETRVARMGHPVLDTLVAGGDARPAPHALGLDTDAQGGLLRADGRAQPRLHAIGSLRIGTLWESIAVPELRQDAQALASRLLASIA